MVDNGIKCTNDIFVCTCRCRCGVKVLHEPTLYRYQGELCCILLSMTSSVFCCFALFLLLSALASAWPTCANGMTCISLTPSITPELTFDCAYVKATTNPVGNVLYLHGNDGAGSKAMWASQMLAQAPLGFTGLACDARGYSPGASPNNQSAYLYDELAKDLFSLADTFGFGKEYGGKFHVVAHDQGARVTWHAIAKYQGRKRFLSFATLSIPHSDVFSDSLIGPNADRDQQAAAQYVRMLTLPNAMTVDHDRIRDWLCKQENYKTTEACQHAHWYNPPFIWPVVYVP